MTPLAMTWPQRLLRVVRGLLNLGLAAVLGYFLVQVGLASVSPPPALSVMPQAKPLAATAPNAARTQLNVAPVLNAHLFGQAKRPPSPTATLNKPTLPTDIPETRLNLTLYGIYHSSAAGDSYVMMAAGKKAAKRYQLGDEVSKGVMLHDIQAKKVILARGQRYEQLSLRKSLPPTQAARGSRSAGGTPAGQPTPGQLLKNYQQQLQQNPKNLLKLARISPVNRNGQLIGYRLRPGADPSLLAQFELRSGDILTAVNGVALDSPLKGLGVVQQMANASQLDLQILRNGQTMQFSFAIE